MSEQLIFWSEEHLASLSPSLDFEKDLQTLAETSCSRSELLRIISKHDGLSGRTSPVCCPQTKDGTLVPFSGCWQNSGMGSPTEFLTLSSSEFPKGADVCSLSDVLETGSAPQKYYLTAKAYQGILRRAEKRGKKLPELKETLEEIVGQHGGTDQIRHIP